MLVVYYTYKNFKVESIKKYDIFINFSNSCWILKCKYQLQNTCFCSIFVCMLILFSTYNSSIKQVRTLLINNKSYLVFSVFQPC